MAKQLPTAQEVHDEGIDGMLWHLRQFKADTPAGDAANASECPVQRYFSARLPQYPNLSVNTSFITLQYGASDNYDYELFHVEGQWECQLQRKLFRNLAHPLTVRHVRKALRAVKKEMEAEA